MLAAVVAVTVAGGQAPTQADTTEWRGFRGDGRSVAVAEELPVQWSIESGKNVAWTADLPGRGLSSPIVVAGRVIVTAASGPNEDRLHVLAFDEESGQQLWERKIWAIGRTLFHPTSSVAANTPASDGERIFAFYSSNDLVALDLEGNVQWIRGLTINYPLAGNDVGMASSPVIVGDVVVVQSEAQAASFAIGVDVETGETLWEVDRPRDAAWSSPVAVEFTTDGEVVPAVALQATVGLDIHRADNGQKLWSMSAGCSGTSSPVFDDLLYVPSDGVAAFDLSQGDGDPPAVWRESRLKGDAPSPVVHRGNAYVLNRTGVLSSQAVDGDLSWKIRLGGRFWATPVAAGDALYCFNQAGKAFVVQLPDPDAPSEGQAIRGRIVAEIDFGDELYGSPAVANDALFIRSHSRLWKIAQE